MEPGLASHFPETYYQNFKMEPGLAYHPTAMLTHKHITMLNDTYTLEFELFTDLNQTYLIIRGLLRSILYTRTGMSYSGNLSVV